MYRQNTHGILLKNICTGLGLFWADFPTTTTNSEWDLDPPTHFHSNLGFLEFCFLTQWHCSRGTPTSMVVRRSKFWKSCVIKRCVSTVSLVSILSIWRKMSAIQSKWRWLPATHTKYTYKNKMSAIQSKWRWFPATHTKYTYKNKMSAIQSKWRWLPATHTKYTYGWNKLLFSHHCMQSWLYCDVFNSDQLTL